MQKYWVVRLYGHHVIRAETEEEALEIVHRHGIGKMVLYAAPKIFHDREYRVIGEADPKIVKRRREGLGGNVWFEDEKGNLKTETHPKIDCSVLYTGKERKTAMPPEEFKQKMEQIKKGGILWEK